LYKNLDREAGASDAAVLRPATRRRGSRRERQILRLIREGTSTADIAGALFLSPKTIHTYRSRLMQ